MRVELVLRCWSVMPVGWLAVSAPQVAIERFGRSCVLEPQVGLRLFFFVANHAGVEECELNVLALIVCRAVCQLAL